jgi:cell division transport system permease protein
MMDIHLSKPGPIIPPEAAPLRNLTVTMTVMCYLASLAIGALILIEQAVDGWTRGLAREVTVQVRQVQSQDLDSELSKALAILKQTRGILKAESLDRDASLKLLEPWLGDTNLNDLPVPRLIRVTVDENTPPDFDSLAKTLKDQVQGASLDTHRRWQTELARMGRTLSMLAFLILGLIGASAFAMVVFAARAVLAANQEVVDVLHLVGAKDSYIARQIDRRFLVTGLIAGCAGVALGVITFFVLSLSGNSAENGVAQASHSLLFAPDTTSWETYAILLCVPLAATAIAVVSAKLTLTRMLESKP